MTQCSPSAAIFMHDKKNGSHAIEQIIANGRRVVAEAQATLERNRRFLAENDLDSLDHTELLNRPGGEQALKALNDKMQELMSSIEAEVAANRPALQPLPRMRGSRRRGTV